MLCLFSEVVQCVWCVINNHFKWNLLTTTEPVSIKLYTIGSRMVLLLFNYRSICTSKFVYIYLFLQKTYLRLTLVLPSSCMRNTLVSDFSNILMVQHLVIIRNGTWLILAMGTLLMVLGILTYLSFNFVRFGHTFWCTFYQKLFVYWSIQIYPFLCESLN